ncbi:polyprenyl synthetase family protein [Gracilibacillus kekensis]|uniref:Geranylgeranyl pyrophosphate synthase n=1 Tax=Gracilibacillus kekensis TaxID=1027249 RepID=A0A1M7QAK7_9BACI|nr:polyprenyl synthetase family protein [Gracilibacillus kekensis]SHN27645.1 Geranylgeranyl pyrophosphate synthase [Gracilibacillus kekensis]
MTDQNKKQFQEAEHIANAYFEALTQQLKEKSFAKILVKDLKRHGKQKNKESRFFHLESVVEEHYSYFLKKLSEKGKLNRYLERSITYIYMRDLGRDVTKHEVKNRIKTITKDVQAYLGENSEQELFSLITLYQIAQKEKLESTFFWLIEKLKVVSSIIPDELNKVHAQRKLIKIIAGVLMHEIESFPEGISLQERSRRLDKAVRIGYCYGLTYPFIDDLLDSNFLTEHEKEQFSNLIEATLNQDKIAALNDWQGEHEQEIRLIYHELSEAYTFLKESQSKVNVDRFYQNAYLFFHAQEVDRNKDLADKNYTNEEIYIPVILKSSSSRMIVRSFQMLDDDHSIDQRMFYYGIYNQLADDLADLDQDLNASSVTPYTYYLKHKKNRPDLVNPFALYWTVISYLINNVYHGDPNVRQILLDRAINGLKRLKQRVGADRYEELMDTFSLDMPSFEKLLQKSVAKVNNVAFFDKLLRDQMIQTLKENKKKKEKFHEMSETLRSEINGLLEIEKQKDDFQLNHPLIDAANYSIIGGGKRLRPIMTSIMATEVFQLDKKTIIPLIRAVEYMHTASLIFDDLPTQDNANIRRGRKTVHQVYNSAVAELTSLFMTQKAVEEQTNLASYDANTVLELIQYSTQVTQEMCKGQIIDLEAKGKALTLEELTQLCFYKTGIGFEASLMMPAILAGAKHSEKEAIKTFSYHAGIAFQIKDDLLDLEADTEALGKTVGIDVKNNSATFVTVLGIEGAKKELWNHYREAMISLQSFTVNTDFFEELMHYIVHRNS